jgi:hypothetical protein
MKVERRAWLVPVSSAFALSAMVTLAAFALGPGCQTRCFNNFDCGERSYCSPLGRCETECFTDIDCRHPPECEDNTICQPRGFRCNSVGRCVGTFDIPRIDRVAAPDEDDYVPGVIEGWDESPGFGRAFIVNQIAIAGQDRGFDIDGNCGADDSGCIDNILWQLGELGNDQIRQGLLGGESLLLLELAGLDTPFEGDDRSMTVKIYGARDADDPFFPANNFKVPPGHTTCCEFKINPQSITGVPPQARARAPAKIERGRLFSLAPVPIQFTLTVGVPPHPEIRLEKVLLSGRVPPSLKEFAEGLLGGAVPINTLAQTENPYCKTVSPRCTVQFTDSTLIDLVSTLLRPEPDIDLDVPTDGIECVLDTDGDGRIDRCCDGNGLGGKCADSTGKCTKAEVPAIVANEPWTCALNPKIADGYSVAITFTAVAATIVGVGQ